MLSASNLPSHSPLTFIWQFLQSKVRRKALAVRPDQVIRFPVWRVSLLMRRTPAHAITQAMLTEHQYGFRYGLLLVCRFYGSNPMFQIKATGGCIHHIPQICQGLHRETMPGRFPNMQFTTVSDTAGRYQPVCHLATPICYHRSRYEPVMRQVDRNSGSSLHRSIVHTSQSHDLKRGCYLICQAWVRRCSCCGVRASSLNRGMTMSHDSRLHLPQSGQSPKRYLPVPTQCLFYVRRTCGKGCVQTPDRNFDKDGYAV